MGPACVLTHATAALSFVSLLFSRSDLIREFGEVGILAIIIALLTVLTLVPLLGVALSHWRLTSATNLGAADFGIDALRAFCAAVAGRMVSRPSRYSFMSLLLVGALALLYAQLHPRWTLAEEVPTGAKSVAASHLIDEKLAGANPIDVLIRLPRDQSLYAPATLATIADVHATLEKQAGVGNVWSLETLRRWLAQSTGASDAATLREYVNLLPRFLVRRFISANEGAVVVSARVPDAEAGRLLPIIKDLDHALDAVRAAHPSYEIAVAGLPVIAAYNSANMIERLNRGLTAEIIFIAAFIGLAFRSMAVALAVILPAIFPVLLSGDLLWGMGDGLQFASVVALTVSFGLSLSATIHFLNRLRLESRADQDPAIGVARATVLMGPALILTTVVLACGLAATAFSNLPSLRLFGWLSAFAMVMALIADLFILRPTITVLGRLALRWRQRLLQQSACRRFGLWHSRPGNGISRVVHMQRFGKPGASLLGSDTTRLPPAASACSQSAPIAWMAMTGEPLPATMPRIWGVRLVGRAARLGERQGRDPRDAAPLRGHGLSAAYGRFHAPAPLVAVG